MVEERKKKTIILMLSVFAIVLVTVSASYAIFSYTRTGKVNIIQMGDIEFAMLDGDNVSLSNEFPESDEDGNKNEAYTFTVKNTSSEGMNISYNLYLISNNEEENVNYFTNEQIKFSLVKNNAYVADTTSTKGKKLYELEGFDAGNTSGRGLALKNQVIEAGTTDEYELRIWISDDVSYSGEIDEDGLMSGTYNNYQYSLKVQINASDSNITTFISNIQVKNDGSVSLDVSDSKGIKAYAVTDSAVVPGESEWKDVSSVAFNNTNGIQMMASSTNLVTKKTFSFKVDSIGIYYFHVKNTDDIVTTEKIVVEKIEKKVTVNFYANYEGSSTTKTKEYIVGEAYGEFPTLTRAGYILEGFYTEETTENKVTEEDIVTSEATYNLYAKWVNEYDASDLTYSNSTYTQCTDVECSLDELYKSAKERQ